MAKAGGDGLDGWGKAEAKWMDLLQPVGFLRGEFARVRGFTRDFGALPGALGLWGSGALLAAEVVMARGGTV